MRTTEEVLRIAKEGAEKYFPIQMDLLEEFSGIDCASRNEAGIQKVIEVIERIVEPMGVKLEYYHDPGIGTHVIGRLIPENSTGKILILAHTDTVFPEGECEKYPFHIDGEWAYGLGITDCKGGLVTAIYAVKIMQEAGMLPDKEIIFLMNCDEELASPSSIEFFRETMIGADYAFGFEPAREENGVYTSRIGVAEGSIDITGVASHAQLAPLEGRSAVVEMANIILKLVGKNNIEKNLLYNIAPVQGGIRPGIIADQAHARYCVSLNTAASLEQAEQDVMSLENEGIVDGCKIKVTFDPLFPPMERTEGNVKLYEIVKKAGDIMGLPLPEGAAKGSSDTCHTTFLGVPSVDCLGPYMVDVHKVTERMRISTLPERTTLFAIVLATL